MNVIVGSKVLRVRRNVVTALGQLNSNFNLSLEKFVNDSLATAVSQYLENKKKLMGNKKTFNFFVKITNQVPERRTKRLDRSFATALRDYKAGKLKMHNSAEESIAFLRAQ